jgi:hypothetical protein
LMVDGGWTMQVSNRNGFRAGHGGLGCGGVETVIFKERQRWGC